MFHNSITKLPKLQMKSITIQHCYGSQNIKHH